MVPAIASLHLYFIQGRKWTHTSQRSEARRLSDFKAPDPCLGQDALLLYQLMWEYQPVSDESRENVRCRYRSSPPSVVVSAGGQQPAPMQPASRFFDNSA